MTIPGQGKACVMTDIQIALPEGCYGRIGKLILNFHTTVLHIMMNVSQQM